MGRFIALAAALTALVACAGGSADADRIARQTAKGVVNTVVSNRFPGVNAAPFTDCIIDNASIGEVYQIAQAAVVGVNSETTSLVVDIASRPATVQCATDKALSSFLLGA